MSRRRKKGNPVSGWVIVDKPEGPTSTQVVGIVRRLLNAQKAGHAGTLDPLANGILAVALGEATKTIPFIMDAEKAYRFTVRWGIATTTDDAEGETLETSDRRPSQGAIVEALQGFMGEIRQVPPIFSAIKVNGERAYDLARAGEEVELKARAVEIYDARLISVLDQDHAEIEIECSKGTYVRSLARDLAKKLGTCGHVSELRRTAIGPFDESLAIPLDSIKDLGHSAPARLTSEDVLRPIATALDDIPALALNGNDASRLKRGQSVLLRGQDAPILDGTVLATHRGDPVALTEYQCGELKPVRVFNLP